MKKAELKKILKPLIQECIKESLQDKEFLNTIVSEVLQVAGSKALLGESIEPPKRRPQAVFTNDLYTESTKKQKQELSKMKQELMESSKKQFGGVNVFEGVEPLSRGGSTSPSAKPTEAISSYAPDDAGIDISGLVNQNADIWKKLTNA